MMDIPKPQPPATPATRARESEVVHFVKYNNTIPIVLGVIFLGATGTMAATPEVRNAVYTASERTISIDNSRILAVDVDSYPFSVQISSVAEDAEKYYVKYTITTLALVDAVWTDTALTKELVVYKDALAGRDLGTYVSNELAEVREYERRLLAETQAIERTNGLSQKVVATTYAGLVGKFLSPTEEVISGYDPVVADGGASSVVGSDPNRLETPVAAPTFDANASGGIGSNGVAPASGTGGTSNQGDTQPPQVSLLGDSPAYVSIGGTYSDLGVASTDNVSRILRTRRFLNNTEVGVIRIPTDVAGTYSVRYIVTDEAGNATERVRSVIVGGTQSSGGGSTSEPEPTPAPEQPVTADPAPAPAPEPEPTPAPEASSDTSADSSSGSSGSDSSGASGGETSGGGESAPSE